MQQREAARLHRRQRQLDFGGGETAVGSGDDDCAGRIFTLFVDYVEVEVVEPEPARLQHPQVVGGALIGPAALPVIRDVVAE